MADIYAEVETSILPSFFAPYAAAERSGNLNVIPLFAGPGKD
jgi:hypothetical protein